MKGFPFFVQNLSFVLIFFPLAESIAAGDMVTGIWLCPFGKKIIRRETYLIWRLC